MAKVMKTKPSHAFIPDTQVKPGVPTDHIGWAGEEIAARKPDVIVQIGDWAEDKKLSLELKIKELDKEIKTRRTEARKLVKLDIKVNEQRAIKELEKKRNSLRRELFDKQDEIDTEKDKLLDTVQSRLESESSVEELFTLKWKLV